MFKKLMRTFGMKNDVPSVPQRTFAQEHLDRWHAALSAGPPPDEDIWRSLALLASETFAPEGAPESEVSTRLNFGRSVLGLLLENDALPPRLQLEPEHFEVAMDLLRAFFFSPDSVEDEAQRMLHLVESRVAAPALGQAKALLNLFDTEASTKRQNELNLFYEGMLHRFQTKDAALADSEGAQRARPEVLKLLEGDQEAVFEAARRVAATWGIHLHTFAPLREMQGRWALVLPSGLPEDRRDRVLQQVAAPRWRGLHSAQADVCFERLQRHVERRSLASCAERLASVHLFVARMSGRTGMEPLLPHFFRWMVATFDGDPIRVLPEINRRIVHGQESMTVILEDVCATHLSVREAIRPSPELVLAELTSVLRDLVNSDPSDVPPGDYDVGSLVHDRIAGYRPDVFGHALRMHRIL